MRPCAPGNTLTTSGRNSPAMPSSNSATNGRKILKPGWLSLHRQAVELRLLGLIAERQILETMIAPIRSRLLFLVVTFCFVSSGLEVQAASQPRLSDYIRPFVGTQGEGNTYPGPSAPFGMVQLSPDTDKTNWDTASGYEYTDPTILGFSLTHLSGTGIPDLGDFLFMPQIGNPQFISGETAELTAGQRAGILRFTFPASDQASIMTDLSHVLNGGRWKVAQSHVRIE